MGSGETGTGAISGSGEDSGGGSSSVDIGGGVGFGLKKNHHISPTIKVIMKTARIPRVSKLRLGGLIISSAGGSGVDGSGGKSDENGCLGGGGVFGGIGAGVKNGGVGCSGSSFFGSRGGNGGA